MFTLSVFAVPTAAAHDPTDPEHDTIVPHTTVDEKDTPASGDAFLPAKKAFGENVPETVFDERVGHLIGPNRLGDEISDSPFDERVGHLIGPNRLGDELPNEKSFPGADWDSGGSDDEEIQDGSDPVVVAP